MEVRGGYEGQVARCDLSSTVTSPFAGFDGGRAVWRIELHRHRRREQQMYKLRHTLFSDLLEVTREGL